MSLEHFAAGAGSAVHVVRFMGATGPVPTQEALTAQNGVNKGGQAPRLYRAERGWREADPERTSSMSLGGTRDFIGEAFNHPGLDEIPGIQKLRDNFDASAAVKFRKNITSRSPDGTTQEAAGAVHPETGTMYFTTDPAIRTVSKSTVLHEAAHRAILAAGQFGEVSNLKVNHEWPQARLHVAMVRNMLGTRHARALKDYYEHHGVNFGGRGV